MRPPKSCQSREAGGVCAPSLMRPQSSIEATNLRFSLYRERSSTATIGWISFHNDFPHHLLCALASLLGRDRFKSKPVRRGVQRGSSNSISPLPYLTIFSGNFRSPPSQAPLPLASLHTPAKRTLVYLLMCYPPLRS